MASSISHGINYLNYITGEAEKKTRPDLIHRIHDNLIEPMLDPMGIWMSMELTVSRYPRPITNNMIEIVLSPSAEYTKDFSVQDWQQLWKDFAREFDSLEFYATKGKYKGKVYSRKTNISNSKTTVWLHQDSASSTPHLHAAVCRIDKDGKINNDHNISQRAQIAAERVAIKRGWVTANGVREQNLGILCKECKDIMKGMPSWSWDDFKSALESHGHNVWTRFDNQGNLVAWAIVNGDAKYNSSKIHQRLAPGKIKEYWAELRGKEELRLKAESNKLQSHQQELPTHYPTPHPTSLPPYSTPHPSHPNSPLTPNPRPLVKVDMGYQGNEHHLYIPLDVWNLFTSTYSDYEYSNSNSLVAMCVVLFVELALPPSDFSTCGGGGGSSDKDREWGRDPKEEDIEWAMRCARMAAQITRPITRTQSKRR